MTRAPAPEYPRWAFKVLGAVVVAGLAYWYFGRTVSETISILNVTNNYWTGFAWTTNSPLFGYLILLTDRLSGDPTIGLYRAAEVVCLLLPLSVYVSLLKFFGRWEASLVGSAIVLFSPAYLAAASASAYSLMLGLAIIFPALYVGYSLSKSFSDDKVPVVALAALGVAASEPLLGAALGVSLCGPAYFAFRRGSRRAVFLPAASLIVAGLAFTTVTPGPGLGFGGSDLLLAYLAVATAAVAAYLNWRERKEQILPLGIFSLVAGAFSLFLDPQFLIFAALPLASTIVLSAGRLTGAAEGGTGSIQLNLSKAASLVLVALILVADIGTAAAAAAAASSSNARTASRYGESDLGQAMGWLKQNTAPGSVVLAESPLSEWVSALGGRPVVSNANLGTTPGYDADTMLNSTYELRNGFLRVRDWAPVAPQRSPSISISNGTAYVDVLYVDENHFNLLDANGNPIVVPYSNETKLASGYSEVNGSLALQQKYVVDGVNVDRYVSLGGGGQGTLEYVVHSNLTGVISGARVQIWVSKDRTIGYNSLQGDTLRLDTDAGNLVVTSSGPGESLTFGPDKVYGQTNLDEKFNSSASTFAVTIAFSESGAPRISWARGLEAVSTLDLYSKYHVSYLVVPTLVKSRQLDLFGVYFPTFTSVFQDGKLTIYLVELPGP